ncbi:LacI family DNA-binding transcriptional regulator [Candidatus Aerophobetes bacterium]|nr:LacI family DNA-binding transcriptional regulator [Candidatus Aerophobetes bacterium]
MQKVTIIDVAKKAGVSPTTVSRVLNDNTEKHMREETKQRVLKVIRELDYTPDKYAQFMKKQKSGVIGVLVPDISNQFFSLMVRGVENVCYKNGYSVIICDTKNSLERENNYIDIVLKERVEGIVLTSSSAHNEQIKKAIKKRIPVILADRRLRNVDLPYVGSDGFKDGYKMTQYLIDLGYKKIGFIKGPSEVATALERFKGYVRAMNKNGLEIGESYIRQGDYTFEGGYWAAKEMLTSCGRLPQAIIAANDLMAIGIIRAFEERGLKIPENIGIAGFDNISISSWISPKLTTVEIPAYSIGQEAASILIKHIRRETKLERNRIVETKLIKGESCIRIK